MMLQFYFLPAAPRVRRRNAPLPLQLLTEAVRHAGWPHGTRLLCAALFLPLCLLLTSCPRSQAQVLQAVPARVEVPAMVVAHFFLVEARVNGAGPYRFLIDTGSTLSLVSPAVVRGDALAGDAPNVVHVRSPRGDAVALPKVELARVELGAAAFRDVAAGIYDFTDLSEQLGTPVHGLIGFPVFREVLLTLDYPGRRLVLAPAGELTANDGELLALDHAQPRPFVALRVGANSIRALIDTGSDAAVSLNVATAPHPFAGPLRGTSLNASISGDFPQVLGRLATDVHFGSHAVTRPIVEITRGDSALGGALLQHFSLTFDQRRGLLAVQRAAATPIEMAPRRGTGAVFDRASDRWLVAAVLPASPAEQAAMAAGDVCVRVNGQPTAEWPLERFEALLRESDAVTFTLAAATGERDVRVPIAALVQ